MSGPSRPWLLLLSAKASTALDQATSNLHHHLEQHPEQPLADVAYTLQVGGRPLPIGAWCYVATASKRW
jgi:acyl transferase domain-containing protein